VRGGQRGWWGRRGQAGREERGRGLPWREGRWRRGHLHRLLVAARKQGGRYYWDCVVGCATWSGTSAMIETPVLLPPGKAVACRWHSSLMPRRSRMDGDSKHRNPFTEPTQAVDSPPFCREEAWGAPGATLWSASNGPMRGISLEFR